MVGVVSGHFFLPGFLRWVSCRLAAGLNLLDDSRVMFVYEQIGPESSKTLQSASIYSPAGGPVKSSTGVDDGVILL
ncbi:hypothetical protein [Trueperella bernardiae]|uniref:hypothetical protein n=1 Tax=Trueperella bernardiae TaxID=59561 RepID=UPI0023F01ABA|nr:hypothetical protein [Trueperella bernardiae]